MTLELCIKVIFWGQTAEAVPHVGRPLEDHDSATMITSGEELTRIIKFNRRKKIR